VIRTTDSILEDEPWGRARWDAWWSAREKSLPALVIADENDVAQGYAIVTYFGDRSGYRVTGEVSIHLEPGIRGKGHGTRLLGKIVEAGRSHGFVSLVSRISSTNLASIALHDRAGFVRVGHLHKVARKFGALVDVYYYQMNFTG